MKTLAKLCPWSSNSSTRRSPRGAESNTWYLSLGEVREEVRKSCSYSGRPWLQPPRTVLRTQTRNRCMAGGKKKPLLSLGHPVWPRTSCLLCLSPSKGPVRLNSFPFVKRLCVFWRQAATEAECFQAHRQCGDMFTGKVGLARCALPLSLAKATKAALFPGTRLFVLLYFSTLELHKPWS